MDLPNLSLQNTILEAEVAETRPMTFEQLKQEEGEVQEGCEEGNEITSDSRQVDTTQPVTLENIKQEVEEEEEESQQHQQENEVTFENSVSGQRVVPLEQLKQETDGEVDASLEKEEEVPRPLTVFIPIKVEPTEEDDLNDVEGQNCDSLEAGSKVKKTPESDGKELKNKRRKASIGNRSLNAKRMRLRREKETFEEREARLARARMYIAMRRAAETPEEREARLACMRRRYRGSKAAESPEMREKRLYEESIRTMAMYYIQQQSIVPEAQWQQESEDVTVHNVND